MLVPFSFASASRSGSVGRRMSMLLQPFSELIQNQKQRTSDAPAAQSVAPKIETHDLQFFYGKVQALHNINVAIAPRSVTALIGPSGCGKSTFLRTLNRMNDLIESHRVSGRVMLDGTDIYAPDIDVVALRKKVGMVFQKSNPFPKSIFDNIAYGPRIAGNRNKN